MVAAGSITVAVRVRPPSAWEAARLPEPCYDTTFRGEGALSTPGRSVPNTSSSLREIVQVVDDRILTFDPAEQDRARAFMDRGFLPPGTKRYKDKRFMFDKVFTHDAKQHDVYESTSQPLLQGLLDGYNATVFAYGATGCGKTHTISGTDSDPGIIYLTMADLFQRIEDRRDNHVIDVVVTFLEIYNEEIRDLLAESTSNTRGGLSIREDKTVKVVGLTELKPQSAEQVKEIVLLGNSRRTQSPTHANETSSRSHAVLQVHVTQSPRTAALTEQRTMATLSIIDLAGSERAAATSNMGQRMVEGANINKSLLALGNCINALCESGGSLRHVPYRNSKLTRLLKFSLGGNCKTVMIVCIAPTSNHFDDTHNTLVYAERATKIKTKVVTRNVVNVDRHVGRYVEAINRLNSEVAELKSKLAGKVAAENEVSRRKKAEASAEMERAKSDVKARADQMKASILDGATCLGKVMAAKAKLAVIRARLEELNKASYESSLSEDLEAEKLLLKALAEPEELIIKPDSTLNSRLQRSTNSSAMFDATLRAVSERRSDKIDEVSVENVKLDAKRQKAEMERIKAEGERDVMKEAVETMAQLVVGLVGMLGRCTVMVGEAASVLGGALEMNEEVPMQGTVKRVASSLKTVKEKNDDAFTKLIGHSTEGYAIGQAPLGASLDSFAGYSTSWAQKRASSGPSVAPQQQQLAGGSRRSSSYGSVRSGRPSSHGVGSPVRHGRTPRKSLRSSMAGQPYRRVSDKEKKGSKPTKNVRWGDEVGQGDVDDKISRFETTVAPAVVVVKSSPSDDRSLPSPSSGSKEVNHGNSLLPPRCTSLGGSESEWEDENEKTDDSVHLNYMSMSLPSSTRCVSSSASSASTVRPIGTMGTKRPRANRLDPGFLKSKMSTLGSLAEDDESGGSPVKRPLKPLADRNFNRLPNSDDSSGSEGGKNRQAPTSPGRRAAASSRSGTGSVGGGMKLGHSRRRSNVGPMRNEKGRRRSSLIPQLSPQSLDMTGGPRRVMFASPAKRVKRVSLAGNRSLSTGLVPIRLKTAPVGGMASLAVPDGNTSADMSFNKAGRPTWR